MSDAEVESCGARFFGQDKRELGRAIQVTRRVGVASLLTVLDVAGADPELVRSLSLLDRARLQIYCDDAKRTSYIFRWASGYGNGTGVRIQGVLEPSTGRAVTVPPPPVPVVVRPPAPPPPVADSWDAYRPKRRW